MNRLSGRISAVEVAGSIALVEVTVGTRRYTATLVGVGDDINAWRVDRPVTLLFKETEVSLAKNLSGLISMRNRIQAVVTGIERGQLLTKVLLDAEGHTIASVITTKSSFTLQLEIGDEVEGLVKANEMGLIAEQGA